MKRSENQFPSITNFRFLCYLVTLIVGYNNVIDLRATKNLRALNFEEFYDELESKKMFPQTITHKIFETNSSFNGK